ncbi:MAG: hypothetical protein N4A38_04835 [Candidatus Gracilibacteria bacterium]|nr:hypothetical protein [Candidatus Gracilibacteria bacterium]
MKKLTLFLSALLAGFYLTNFIGAITITKNSGEVLDNLTRTNISSLTDKIDISSSDIKLNGKLSITGELCSVIGGEKKCLGSCQSGYHWEQDNLSCEDNVLDCTPDKTNATLATKTRNSGNRTYGECTIQTCDTGYEVSGNSCVGARDKTISNGNTARCSRGDTGCTWYRGGNAIFNYNVSATSGGVGIRNIRDSPTSTTRTFQYGGYYYAIYPGCNAYQRISGYDCVYPVARRLK